MPQAKPQPVVQECTYCHVEIPAADPVAAKKFFGKVFDWTFEDVPMGDSTYVIYKTRQGGVGGGIMKPPKGAPKQIVNYILVNDIEAYSAKIKKNGGKIVVPKTEIPGFGSMAHFTDPDGNHLALWTPAPRG